MTRRAALAVGIPILVAVLAPSCGSRSDLSDQAMMASFRDHRAAFDSLAAFLREDRHIQMMTDFAHFVQTDTGDLRNRVHNRELEPEFPGLPAERWRRYTELLHTVEISRNVWNDSVSTLFMKSYARGADVRGFYYSEVAPHASETVDRDIMSNSVEVWGARRPASVDFRYRTLAPGWYLYRQRSADGD